MGCGVSTQAEVKKSTGGGASPVQERSGILRTGLSDEGIEVPLLHVMAEHNQVQEARQLLAAGAVQMDEKDATHNVTALMLACAHRHAAMVEFLLQAGAGTDVADADGATALMWAEAFGSSACADLLLKAGANVEARDQSGLTVADYKSETTDEAVVDSGSHDQAELSAASDQTSSAGEQSMATDKGAVVSRQLHATRAQKSAERMKPRVYRGAASMGAIQPPDAWETSGVLWSDQQLGDATNDCKDDELHVRDTSRSARIDAQAVHDGLVGSQLAKPKLAYHGAASFSPDGGGFARGARRPRLNSGVRPPIGHYVDYAIRTLPLVICPAQQNPLTVMNLCIRCRRRRRSGCCASGTSSQQRHHRVVSTMSRARTKNWFAGPCHCLDIGQLMVAVGSIDRMLRVQPWLASYAQDTTSASRAG